MKKRIISVILILCMFIGFAPAAYAVDINDSSVFLKQSKSDTCTYTSAAMMLRRRAIIDGGNWSAITENSVRNATRVPNVGMLNNYTYSGMSVKYQFLSNTYTTTEAKKSFLISMLRDHPEGVVAYNQNRASCGQWHAILMTDYDSATDTFYCADPAGSSRGRIKFSSSTIKGSGQNGKLYYINGIWSITNRSGGSTTPTPPHTTHTKGAFQFYEAQHPHYNYWRCSVCGENFTDGSTARVSTCSQCNPTLSVVSQENGDWTVEVDANYDVLLYEEASSSKSKYHLVAHPEKSYLFCVAKAVLSDGSTRYLLGGGNWVQITNELRLHTHVRGAFGGADREHPHHNHYTCAECREYYTDSTTTPDNTCLQCHWEHVWDTGTVTKPPKVGVDGEKVYICTICGEKKTEKIPQLPKIWGSLEGDGVTYVVGIPDEGFTVTVKADGTLTFNGQGKPSAGGLFSFASEEYWPFIESNVSTVIVGEGITDLNCVSAFEYHLPNLSKIVLPDSMETVSFSLYNNPLVQELYIPKNVKNLWLAIGKSVQKNLKAINVDPQNVTYTSIDGIVYSKDMSEIIRCPGGKEGDCVIPDGVRKIDEKAFAYSDKITSVTVPDSVVEFEEDCFGNRESDPLYATTFAGKLRVNKGSAAERYAIENEIPYELIDPCANGHTWNSGVVTRQPTTTSTGELTYTCTVCGATRTELIAALPSTSPDQNPTPTPTPTPGGYDPTPEPEQPTVNFNDVPAGAYYADAVSWAVANGITSGVGPGQFGPDMRCTRAQMVTFLWKAQGQPEPTSTTNPFVDVKPSDYCYKAVLWAVENGISGGTDSTHFSPSQSCDRAQAVTFIWRTEGRPEAEIRSSFSDVSRKSYYADAIDWAVEYKIVNGVGGGKYDPKSVCSRAQIVTMLYRNATN